MLKSLRSIRVVYLDPRTQQHITSIPYFVYRHMMEYVPLLLEDMSS